MLKEDIIKLANELGIKEHHIQRLLDGTYKAISVATVKPKGRIFLLAKLDPNHNPVIKSTKDYNKDVINNMIELVRLFRLYKLEAKTQARKKMLVYDDNQLDK